MGREGRGVGGGRGRGGGGKEMLTLEFKYLTWFLCFDSVYFPVYESLCSCIVGDKLGLLFGQLSVTMIMHVCVLCVVCVFVFAFVCV